MPSPKISPKNKADLKPNGETFRLLFASHPIPMWVYDVKTLAFLDVNDAALEKYGYSRDEFLALTIKDIRPADAKRVERLIKTLKQKNLKLDHADEWRHRLKNGQIIDVEITTHTLDFEGHKAVLVMAQDITERRQAEEALLSAGQQWQTTFDAIGDSVCLINTEGHIIRHNRAMEKFLGKPASEVDGHLCYELVHGTSEPIADCPFLRMKQSRQRENMVFEFNGRWLNVTTDPILNNDEQLVGATHIVSDITERKQVEEALRESEDKFKYVFDNSTVGKSLTLPSGVMNANQALCDMFGYTQAEFQNKKWREITHPEDIELTQKEIDQLLSGEQNSVRFNKRYIHKNGSVVWVDLSSSLRRNTDGKPLYLMTSVIDITARKQVEMELVQNEAKFRGTFDQSPVGSVIVGLDKHFIRCNSAFCNFLGYSEKELTGKTISDITHPEDLEIGMNEMKQMVAGKIASFTGQKRYLRKDGAIVWAEISIRLVSDANNKPLYFIPIIQDITQRKRAEEALIASQALYRLLAENSSDVISMINAEGKAVYISPAYIRQLGYEENELLNIDTPAILQQIHPDDRERIGAEIKRGRKLKLPTSLYEYRTKTKQGEYIWVEDVLRREFDENGNFVRTIVNSRDITERKRMEEALAESEKKFRALFETMSEGIVYEDPDGKIISANPAAERLLGLSFDQMQGRTSVDPRWKAIHEDGSPFPGETHSLNLAAKTGKPAIGEVMGIYNPKSDAYVWLSVNSTPEFLPDEKKPFRAYAVFRDITERVRAEQALRESESLYRKMNENSPLGMHFYKLNNNDQLVFVGANLAANKLLGVDHSQFIGKTIEEAFPPLIQTEVPERYRDAAAKGIPWSIEQIAYEDKQITGAFEVRAFQTTPGNMVAVFVDITERKQAEGVLKEYNTRLETAVEERTSELREAQEKLVRNEKLAVLGQLAGSVGHELRNPLAVINNAIYYLKLIGADSSEKVKEYLGIIQTETRTAEKIITDLLDFARIKSVDVEPVSVSYLVARVLERYPAPKAVSLRLEIPEDLPKVYVDPRQMEQVLGNLIINACQAMTIGGDSTGGELVITAHQEQEMVAIAVKDNGVGILPENMKKLFEPLFTTKAKGIGLGLAVSQKLAEANGGRIEVQSEAGVGSSFTVYLPMKV